jgi:hypothetical protein
VANLRNVDVYNFYSSGEEVLRWDPADPPAGVLSGALSEVLNFWIEGVPFGTYAWVWQDKGKGTAAHDWFIGSTHGGWKFNDYWGNPPPSPAIMNDTATSTLQDYPMFSVGSTKNGHPIRICGATNMAADMHRLTATASCPMPFPHSRCR